MKQNITLITFDSTCRNIEYTYTLKHIGDEVVLFADNGEVCETMTWDESFIDSAWEVVDHLLSKSNMLRIA
tara:strand:+ start:1602 stop:1814 length:213 start_codon:yes stop_codon:yes gene_type:complete